VRLEDDSVEYREMGALKIVKFWDDLSQKDQDHFGYLLMDSHIDDLEGVAEFRKFISDRVKQKDLDMKKHSVKEPSGNL
jgi:hypothetical protein